MHWLARTVRNQHVLFKERGQNPPSLSIARPGNGFDVAARQLAPMDLPMWHIAQWAKDHGIVGVKCDV